MEKVLTQGSPLLRAYRCSKCRCSLLRSEVWIADDTSDKRVYCTVHTPDSAIRLKDTIQPV